MSTPVIPTEDPQAKSFFGIIVHSFFVVPFLIAVFGVLLFAAVRLLTLEEHTIYDYLNDIKSGGATKRWQAAFELSKVVTNPKLITDEERFTSEVISAFNHAAHDDNRVRQYLALTMGRTGNENFVRPLLSALTDENEGNLYAVIYALGMLKSKDAANAIRPFLDHPNSKVRLASVIALGNIADTKAIGDLKQSLNDSEPNVQWDAAIALAKMKVASGKDVLRNLLTREYLKGFPEVDLQEQTHMLLVAIEAASVLNDPYLNTLIKHLADNDQNMNVRKKAMDILK